MGQQFETLPTGQRRVIPGTEPPPRTAPAPVALPPQPGLGNLSRQVASDRAAAAQGYLPSRSNIQDTPIGLINAIISSLQPPDEGPMPDEDPNAARASMDALRAYGVR